MKLSRIASLASATSLAVLSVPASAAQIIKSYSLDASFASGPLSTVHADFTVSIDPTTAATPLLLSYSSNGAPYYTVPASIMQSAINPSYFNVGGVAGGIDTISTVRDDFYISFQLSPSNTLYSNSSSTAYSAQGSTVNYFATSVRIVDTTAAVPEPASWAMMVGGFGLVGGAMRRRKTAFAFA